jgi:hypothetical protein
MGKQIILFSRWSLRSLFLVYSRLTTLIFALFCAATGQTPKTGSAVRTAAATTTFKGDAYLSSDSTTLKNVKLFFQDCMAPEYGISPDYGVISPWYGPMPTRDSVMTDENGLFEIKLTGSGNLSRSITTEEIAEP